MRRVVAAALAGGLVMSACVADPTDDAGSVIDETGTTLAGDAVDDTIGGTDTEPDDARDVDDGMEADASDDEPLQLPFPERDGVLLGVAVPEGRAALVRDLEVETGASFTVIRVFSRWDSTFPDANQQALLDAGRRLHMSVRPSVGGQPILWRDLAEAQPGDPLYDELVVWADRMVALGPGHYVTINHEPETNESADNGSAEDFVAMWRRFVEVLRDRGGEETVVVWTMTSGSFSDGEADEWYPGDDVVDVVGADVYNWYTCQGSDRPWVDLETLLVDPLAFADAHDKPLALPEFGSSEDRNDPDRKAAWLRDAAATLDREDIAEKVEFAAWFNVTAPGGTWPECVWSHDSNASSAAAFGEFARTLTE